MSANIEPLQSKYIKTKQIEEIKLWNGWNNDMIALIKRYKGLKLAYRIMMKEREQRDDYIRFNERHYKALQESY